MTNGEQIGQKATGAGTSAINSDEGSEETRSAEGPDGMNERRGGAALGRTHSWVTGEATIGRSAYGTG